MKPWQWWTGGGVLVAIIFAVAAHVILSSIQPAQGVDDSPANIPQIIPKKPQLPTKALAIATTLSSSPASQPVAVVQQQPAGPSNADMLAELQKLKAENQKLSQQVADSQLPAPPPKESIKKASYKGETADHWLSSLDDRDIITRREAALALASIGSDGIDKTMAATIQAKFPDVDETVSVRMAIILIKTTGANEQIIAYLDKMIRQDGGDEHFEACSEGVTALGMIGPAAKRSLSFMKDTAAKYGHTSSLNDEYPELENFGFACAKAIPLIDK